MNAEEFAGLCDKSKRTERGFTACCPAHDDRSPSLSIRDADDGKVLIHCHAGCSPGAITAAVGVGLDEMMPAVQFGPTAKRAYAKRKTRDRYQAALLEELYVMTMITQARESQRVNTDAESKASRAIPNDPLEREIQSARRLIAALVVLYPPK